MSRDPQRTRLRRIDPSAGTLVDPTVVAKRYHAASATWTLRVRLQPPSERVTEEARVARGSTAGGDHVGGDHAGGPSASGGPGE